MRHIKNINELKISGIITHETLIEMARINDPKDFSLDNNRIF